MYKGLESLWRVERGQGEVYKSTKILFFKASLIELVRVADARRGSLSFSFLYIFFNLTDTHIKNKLISAEYLPWIDGCFLQAIYIQKLIEKYRSF